MEKCRICGHREFFKQAGYFFCQKCNTQNEDLREEVLELHTDLTTKLKKQRIKIARTRNSGENLGWTSWELYNFVLIGLTDELIGLGVTSDIKLTVLQLWATYLGKIEVAFTSTKKRCIPKLGRRYNKRDAEIIYGKFQSQRRARKRKKTGSSTNTSLVSGYMSEGSSARMLNRSKKLLASAEYDKFMQSQAGSEADGVSSLAPTTFSGQSSPVQSADDEAKVQFTSQAKMEAKKLKNMSKKLPRSERVKYRQKHITTQYKTCPELITPMRLWAILYLALRIHDQPIQLSDMLRYGREGHLSYYKLDHLLPPEITIVKSDITLLSQNIEITHKSMRRMIASMAKLLGICNIISPDFGQLIGRYCQELQLPRDISFYTERMIALSPPKMMMKKQNSYIPNYEGRAMAFLIVTLKILFGLDGITEYQTSRVAESINSIACDKRMLTNKLFSFYEWQRYIECRRAVLINSHFPTKLKYSPDTYGISSLYIKFLEFANSKTNREEIDFINNKHFIPKELVSAMKHCIGNLDNDLPPTSTDIFAPSLTPFHSYLQQLVEHPLHDLPKILRTDFSITKVEYVTKPELLRKLALECNIDLEVIETNLHFIENCVPYFEQPRMSSVNEYKKKVIIENNFTPNHGLINEDVNDYIHRKIPCQVNVDQCRKTQFDDIQTCMRNSSMHKDECNEFVFHDVFSSGKLMITHGIDSESEEDSVSCTSNYDEKNSLKTYFHMKYNLLLSLCEEKSLCASPKEEKTTFKNQVTSKQLEDAKNKFLKPCAISSHKPKCTKKNIDGGIKSQACEGSNIEFTLAQRNEVNIECSSIRENDGFSLSDISILHDDNEMEGSIESFNNTPYVSKDLHKKPVKFFRPSKNYWAFHCIFSRVKPKNFEVFEKLLPVSFRWLLNECANMIEMTTQDLYEEICIIEAYYDHFLKQ